jgi:hypothetical protein
MAERKFFGTADDLRRATAISLGFDLPGKETYSAEPQSPVQKADDHRGVATIWQPDGDALKQARDRIAHFSQQVARDESGD